MILSDEEVEKIQKGRIKHLKEILHTTLVNAKDEDECTDEENEMYADMSNLEESIECYLESEGL